MRFLDLLGIVWGLPLIAWVIWGLAVDWRRGKETYPEWRARMEKAEADYKAGLPPPKKELFWRINDRMPGPYRF